MNGFFEWFVILRINEHTNITFLVEALIISIISGVRLVNRSRREVELDISVHPLGATKMSNATPGSQTFWVSCAIE